MEFKILAFVFNFVFVGQKTKFLFKKNRKQFEVCILYKRTKISMFDHVNTSGFARYPEQNVTVPFKVKEGHSANYWSKEVDFVTYIT